MTKAETPTSTKPLRLWPGVVIVTLQWLAWLVLPVVFEPDAMLFSLPLDLIATVSGVLGAAVLFVWWMFFSRAPWSERAGAIVLMVLAVVATSRIVDPSIAGGMMGMMLVFYSIPGLSLALVLWAVATRHLPNRVRRASLVAAVVLACVPWTLVRTAGIIGSGSEFHWRWTETPEQRLLAQAGEELKPLPAPSIVLAATMETPPVGAGSDTPAAEAATAIAKDEPNAISGAPAAPEWPGFRGPNRDSIIPGVRIQTDWTASPPVEIWRRLIGPGWSSFAVEGDLLYTQEQRGEEEIVACYRVSTGEPVWRHRDPVRFWESNGGAGPRGTPTIDNGRVYAMGATGILNALDARDGALVWSRNAATDTGVEIPGWGIASSPLVIDDVVIVAVSGQLIAYDASSGEQRWLGPAGGSGYSSPHLLTIDGVAQILLLRGSRTISVAPGDGTLLWEHTWVPGVGIVQPALSVDGVLIVVGDTMGGVGMRRLAVSRGPGGWNVEERWTSRGLKPYFNDFVVHEGHAFGFDGSILACIDLADGTRKWKGGRYGNGQFVLLPDQDVLLVLSEEGDLALVSATPGQFTEIARMPALAGKTWNHPVIVGDILLVRNGEEMAAFRLLLADR